MTHAFTPTPRRAPSAPLADITIDPPPPTPPATPAGLLVRAAPMALSVAGVAVMAVAFGSGAAAGRGPTFLAFPVLMLMSTALAAVTGRRARRGGGLDADRADYLAYLGRLGESAAETAAAQRAALLSTHPEPAALWTLAGGPRMWERGATDPDFCHARVGLAARPLAGRVAAPQATPADPVTADALSRFLACHATIDAPVSVDALRGAVTVEGDRAAARGLLRAVVCQLAVLHPPDQLLIAAAASDRTLAHWEWLKWLPHNHHPQARDALGAARMVYAGTAEAGRALAGLPAGRVLVITDLDDDGATDALAGAAALTVGPGRAGEQLVIRQRGEAIGVECPDEMALYDALVCARRLARYRIGAARHQDWLRLAGIGDAQRFDPRTLWRTVSPADRLRAPIGTDAAGAPLELDIKEPAERGLGPHGLCVGATGSGKSELLRTIALGMMTRNPPDVLNVLLVDFKGGATFLDFADSPQVAAVITNLADDAPLVERMRAALAGELNRRQQLLRDAGCDGVAAYERARRAGAGRPALPTLFVIVDEFSELLSQHPDFIDTFVAIGRLGRSLGVHLLLASQRLDEGRLRGLDAHLSYRICLKTLSAADSRAVLGCADAYQLPNTPGAGFMRVGAADPIRFHAASVSGPAPSAAPARPSAAAVARVFRTAACGAITWAAATVEPPPATVLRAVLDRLAGHGPPAHPVWLPPLGSAPALHTLLGDGASGAAGLVVPLGLVDRPYEQRRTPLSVDLSGGAGNVAIVGAPQSGKSTAVRTLITALAATHDPRLVQFYCLDLGGGALASVQSLPHVGAVVGRADPRRAARVVAECEAVIRSREAAFAERGIVSIGQYRRMRVPSDGDAFGDLFLVIDGWGSVRAEFEALEAPVTAIAAQGLSFGVHVVLTASRWAEVRPSLRDQIGTRIELRLGDPADSEIDRRAARFVPVDRPGRGLARDGSQLLIALPEAPVAPGDRVAPPIASLPTRVHRDALPHGPGVLLGVQEHRLEPLAIDFERHGHLLILGDDGCGKTATLRTVCRELVRTRPAAQARLLLVDFRRTLLGVVASEHCGGHAMSAVGLGALLPSVVELLRSRLSPAHAGQEQLRAGPWWRGPDVYVVVDDYDLVAAPTANPLAGLLEFLPCARDLGLHLVVARRSGGAERALFEPLLAGLRDHGCMTLSMSGCPEAGTAFGASRPVALPPGRGVVTARGADSRLVQVAWSPP
ncbi:MULTISPECIES: type VII secretion protein EccCb [unclassified Mycobacterium]|uniref:type VII secretion protein EccCb n=1 Tax=unclassified Mycobacterium TaxID=2642494 RepID=UPI0008009541|nr:MULTISPECIES: type VII secretion protein EccCb [unclassified Mycobacterium]OBG79075.1 type VII secretion protein EccCb [Mycobacterium sp. E1214]OBH30056.1 type VII secretion protein EccCb [Mycobacterium sp. E1319]